MFFIPKVRTQPKKVPKSTLSLKIKITRNLFKYKKIIPEDKPGLNFQYSELQEKWETLSKPPEKNDFLEFISGIDSLIDHLIGENNIKNNSIINNFIEFKEESIILGIPYFGATLNNDYKDYITAQNSKIIK